jgi:hypothetical protein
VDSKPRGVDSRGEEDRSGRASGEKESDATTPLQEQYLLRLKSSIKVPPEALGKIQVPARLVFP